MTSLFSKSGQYAVQAVLLLASRHGPEPVPLRVLAEELGAPRHFLSKVLGILERAGILSSRGGRKGGYLLGRPAGRITLHDVVHAVEPRLTLGGCVLGYAEDSCLRPCPVCVPWIRTRKGIRGVLMSRDFAHLNWHQTGTGGMGGNPEIGRRRRVIPAGGRTGRADPPHEDDGHRRFSP